MRTIVDYDPSYGSVPVSTLLGFVWVVHFLQSVAAGKAFSAPVSVVIALLCAFPVGYALLIVASWFACGVGKWFGGCGTFHTVRTAMGWGSVPNTVPGTVIWVILLCRYGRDAFLPGMPPVGNYVTPLTTLLAFAQSLFIIWSVVTRSHTLGSVHRFSPWKGLCTCIVASIVEAVCGLLLIFLLGGIGTILRHLSSR